MDNYSWSVVAGIAGLALFLILAMFVTFTIPRTRPGRRNLLELIEGADGRLSTSKFQWFAWTGVIAGAYCAVYTARILMDHHDPISQIPNNVLIALGFSTATMATAKGVTAAYVAQGRVPKEPSPVAANSKNASIAGGLLTDDAGIVDLSKVQLMTFTIIALAVYVYTVTNQLSQILAETKAMNLGLPDIDASLMVLMGLSQAGYVGKKLATSPDNQVAILSLVPGVAQPGDDVTLYGAHFGPQQGADSHLTINKVPVPTNHVTSWTDSKMTFRVPVHTIPGGEWPKTQDVAVGVVVEGTPSASTLSLTVTNPKA
jgi:hypothetical protein